MFINVPDEILLYIITFGNFKSREFIKLRNINKLLKGLMDRSITLEKYPYLRKESLTSFTVSYHQYINTLNLLREEAEREYEISYSNMLIENGWM
jgi:hypothetical protein